MTWLILTLSCIILWGITDILLKKSLDYSDSLSQYKTFVWIGIVMAPAGVIMAICSDTLLDSIMMVKDNMLSAFSQATTTSLTVAHHSGFELKFDAVLKRCKHGKKKKLCR